MVTQNSTVRRLQRVYAKPAVISAMVTNCLRELDRARTLQQRREILTKYFLLRTGHPHAE